MSDLEDKTKELNQGKSAEERIDALLQAFELFCQETSRLEAAYSALKQEFRSVNLELEETNEQLNQKVFELHQLTQYLENILSHISQGLLFIDLRGNITTFNPAAETILEKSRLELRGAPYSQFFSDKMFGFSMHEALQTKEAPSFTRISISSASGKQEKLLDVETRFILRPGSEHDSNQEVNGLIITVRDITELNRLEVLASRHDRMKDLGLLAAEVAHEIRNPLGGIKGFASLLKRDLKSQPELEKMASYIIEGTDSLNDFVTQVLNYSRPVKPHFSRIKMSDLILETKAMIDLDSNLTQKPHFDIQIYPDDLEVSLDYQMVKGALLNLFVNSTQAMPQGGTLRIRGILDKNDLLIEVADTGIGIPKENVEKIFSPFFTTKPDGNGFGLAEVHKVVQAHGGQIDVTSQEGKGTTFKIKIPQKV